MRAELTTEYAVEYDGKRIQRMMRLGSQKLR